MTRARMEANSQIAQRKRSSLSCELVLDRNPASLVSSLSTNGCYHSPFLPFGCASMSHGLLAPQFGLGRIPTPDTDIAQRPSSRDVLTAAAVFSGPAPTVVIKRRRLPADPETLSGDAAAPATPHKAPKVYRLAPVVASGAGEAPGQATLPPSDATTEISTDIGVPAPPKLRRRRDATRQPTLLKHVVVERPAPDRPPEPAVGPGEADKIDLRAARGALQELDSALLRVARAQEAFRALDEHLRALGIPRSAA